MFQELFLDSNAHTPLHPRALETYVQFQKSSAAHGNPAAPHSPGREAALALQEARNKIASLLQVKSNNIYFTSGSTQACQWAMEIFFELCKKNYWGISCSPVEHPAVREAYKFYCQKYLENDPDGSARYLQVSSDGIVELDDDSKEEAVVCIHLQNEIGTIQTFNKHKFIFSDTSQSLGKIPVNFSDFDLAIGAAHKFGGPTGFGFLYIKDAKNYQNFGTGSRYLLDRPGTADVVSAVATAVALEESLETLESRTLKMQEFQTTLENGLIKKGIEIVGYGAKRSPNTTFIYLPKNNGMKAVLELSERGIHCGLGSACGSFYSSTSPVIKALNRSGGVGDYMRISQWGNYGAKEAQRVLDELEKVV